MATLFQQVYEKRVSPSLLKRFLPGLIEISLPAHCGKQWGPPTASAQSSVNPADPGLTEPAIGDASQPRVKSYLVSGQSGVPDFKDPWSPYGLASGQARQVRDFAQLAYYLRKLNGLQYGGLVPEYSTVGQQGDVINQNLMGSAAPADTKPRTKRFMFADPAEGPYMPSLFSIMTGTAQDPNTAKRVEFGGDAMRNMIANSFMSFLPPGIQPPAGKEGPELVKNLAPIWYMSGLQRPVNPVPRVETRPNGQKRTPDGYYGDPSSAKIRKRRDSSEEKYSNVEKSLWIGDNYAIPLDIFTPQEKGKCTERSDYLVSLQFFVFLT